MRRLQSSMESETSFQMRRTVACRQTSTFTESDSTTTRKADVDVPEILTLLGQLQLAVQSLESHFHPVPRGTRKPRIPFWVTNNLLLITLVWQSACILGLTVVELTIHGPDKQLRGDQTYYISLVVLVVCQGVNLCLVIITSVKLTKQMLHHTASSSFLFQSYASTLVLFAGLYTLLYRIEDTSFEHVTEIGNEKSVLIVDLFLKMMYFSTSNSTLCGSSKIYPTTWYSIILVMIQMLLSFIYFASILTQATSHHRRSDNREQASRATRNQRSLPSASENNPLIPPKNFESGLDVLGESTDVLQ